SRKDSGGLDVIEVWKILLQVGVAFLLDTVLTGATPVGCSLAIFAVDLVHNGHSLDDFSKRRETHAVEIGIVSKVDEQLCGSGVRSGRGEGDRAAGVACLNR